MYMTYLEYPYIHSFCLSLLCVHYNFVLKPVFSLPNCYIHTPLIRFHIYSSTLYVPSSDNMASHKI